jgi:hypothetical protein
VPDRINVRKLRQQRQREKQRAARAAAAKEDAKRAEIAAEELAPAGQRHPVLGEDGEVYRVARVDRAGLTFKKSNPVAYLRKLGSATWAHQRAAERLVRSWEDGGRGIGRGASLYGERTSATPQSGWISDQVLAQIRYQNRCKAEFEAAHSWLGALFPAIQAVVLDGIDVTAWSKLARKPDGELQFSSQQVAKGYLLGALDRLVEFYEAVDRSREAGPAEMRSVRITDA